MVCFIISPYKSILCVLCFCYSHVGWKGSTRIFWKERLYIYGILFQQSHAEIILNQFPFFRRFFPHTFSVFSSSSSPSSLSLCLTQVNWSKWYQSSIFRLKCLLKRDPKMLEGWTKPPIWSNPRHMIKSNTSLMIPGLMLIYASESLKKLWMSLFLAWT
jgi:hypothetical protein